MLKALIIFTVLIAAVGLGLEIRHDAGYLLITINHWTIEMTLWIALLVFILVFFLMHTGLLLLYKIKNIPSSVHHWQNKRRVQKAQSKTKQGLIEFSEGYWSLAKKHLINALPNADTPLLNYLTAARAAQEMGDSQLRDAYLREAQQSMPDAKIAVELTQAQLQLANQQWEQALATLRHLQDLAPKHPYVLKLLMQLYQEVKDWPALINLLPELKKFNVVSGPELKKLQQHSYRQAIFELAQSDQTQALTHRMAALPKELTNDPEIIAEYSRFLIKNKEETQAERILRRGLQKQYNPNLMTLYGQITPTDSKPLTFAESFIKKQPYSVELYLCLGRLSFATHLWGKAQKYLEKSLSIAKTPEAYAQLGYLLEQLNDHSGACLAYQQGLNLANAEKLCG